jgi:hypothetical protein
MLVNQAILVLYRRACLLSTAQIIGQAIDEADHPFFSDEGLY